MAFKNYGNRFQQTTPIVLNLVIINVLVYLAQMVTGGDQEPNAAADIFALDSGIRFFPFFAADSFAMCSGDCFLPFFVADNFALVSGESFLPFCASDIFALASGETGPLQPPHRVSCSALPGSSNESHFL